MAKQNNPALTFAANGLVNGDVPTGGLATLATGVSHVSSYAISQGNLANGNYAVAYVAANLVVTPAMLACFANPATRRAGIANSGFSGRVAGFRLADTAANATTGALDFASGATLSTPPGRYAILGAGYIRMWRGQLDMRTHYRDLNALVRRDGDILSAVASALIDQVPLEAWPAEALLALFEALSGDCGSTIETAKARALSRHLFVDMPVPRQLFPHDGSGSCSTAHVDAGRWGDRLRADLAGLVPCGGGLHLVDYAEVAKGWAKTAA